MDQGKNVIVILGGGLKNDNGRWRTTGFDEGDNFGVDGSCLRVAAGYYLYVGNPDIFLIASGGKGQYWDIPGAPTVGEVIREELIELGVGANKIITEENSNNTWQQLREIKKIIINREPVNITIISNDYHLPRIRAMIEYDREFNEIFRKYKIKLQSAEEICLTHKPKKWQKIIDMAYQGEKMKDRIKIEQKGVGDIRSGKYKFK